MAETALLTQEFDFYGDKIIAVKHEEEWIFSPRHMCEAMGLTWPTQQKKINKDTKKFSCSLMATTGKDGKTYKMLGIPAKRINTWILSINSNKVKDTVKREALERYQTMLSDWLYEAGFLGAAINEHVPSDQVDLIISAAKDRFFFKKETLEDYKSKIEIVASLPELDGMDIYKARRIQMLTDIKIGVANPLYTSGVRGVARITEELFYRAYMMERWCIDKLICYFPLDLPTTEAVMEYINLKGYPPPHSVETINPTEARQMLKAYTYFNSTINDLVVYHNKPADFIHMAMKKEKEIMEGIFKRTRVKLEFPEVRDWKSMSARKDEYMKMAEWWEKRNAFFKVFNCCWKCGSFVVASGNFNAHHLHYDTLGFESPWDLSPMCRPCHEEHEGKKKQIKS